MQTSQIFEMFQDDYENTHVNGTTGGGRGGSRKGGGGGVKMVGNQFGRKGRPSGELSPSKGARKGRNSNASIGRQFNAGNAFVRKADRGEFPNLSGGVFKGARTGRKS